VNIFKNRSKQMNLLNENLAREQMSARLGEAQQLQRGRELVLARRMSRKAENAARQARLALALHGQRPTAPAGAKPRMERKPVRGRQGQEGLSVRLDCRRLTAAVM
jgi:hypothetical protein